MTIQQTPLMPRQSATKTTATQKAKIITVEDLYSYSIALRNSGVTVQNLEMLELQSMLIIFGKTHAKSLITAINNENPEEPTVWLTELIEGDNVIYSGLRPLLSIMVCMNLLSQNRIQVARQNITQQPSRSKATSKREENDVIQSLAFSAKSIIFALSDFLAQEGKNPIGLKINENVIQPTKATTNTSGKIPANIPYFGGILGQYF